MPQSPSPTQQEFLRAAMAELGMTRDAFCKRIACPVRTLNKWLLPSESTDFREMNAWARQLVREVMEHVVPGKVMNKANGMLSLGNIFFLPSVALAKNTTYTVHFVATEMSFDNAVMISADPVQITFDDVPLRTIDKTWTFTTGSI